MTNVFAFLLEWIRNLFARGSRRSEGYNNLNNYWPGTLTTTATREHKTSRERRRARKMEARSRKINAGGRAFHYARRAIR